MLETVSSFRDGSVTNPIHGIARKGRSLFTSSSPYKFVVSKMNQHDGAIKRVSQRLSRERSHSQNLQRRVQGLENNNLNHNFESDTTSQTLINFLVHLCCAIGCLRQSYELADEYLEYQIRDELLFYAVAPVIPPVVTLCLYKNYKTLCAIDTCLNSTTSFFNTVFDIDEITRRGLFKEERIFSFI